jgi:Spondin_N
MTALSRSRSFAFLAAALLASVSMAEATESGNGPSRSSRVFEVSITNLTRGQTFTPILVATHSPRAQFFELGEPAGNGLAVLAEDGNTAVLASELASTGEVLDAQTIPGLLAPGATATIRVRANARFDRLSIAAMLIPTNDSFMALSSLDLPWIGGTVTRTLIAYDAGSEPNDERCANIPGPRCGGEGSSPSRNGEGFVHVSNGMHGIGDLAASVYDWRNPVARVVIRRVD